MITRLYPINVDTSTSDLTPTGTPETILQDASDATFWSRTLTTFEPSRFVRGANVSQLPASSGKMKGVTIGVRAWCNLDGAADFVVTDYSLGTAYFSAVLTATPTLYTSAPLTTGPFASLAAMNAMNWGVISRWIFSSTNVRIADLYFDVEWYPQSGFAPTFF